MYILVCQHSYKILATCQTKEDMNEHEVNLKAKGKKTKCISLVIPQVGDTWNDQVFWDAVINPIMRY